ncbi:fimbrial protein [Citrobacter freundii]|uniref:fimbrial protein n=1 Tax=Citrobacter freundii TaxID=546 RepID=UPI0015E92242|nr:fimbrial protein [Citrobacter freundii]QLR79177.1 fimbrial protein [Citrobacter freundii]
MRRLLKSGGLLLLLWLVSVDAQASCNYANGATSEITGYINFGNVSVQRDASVGSVIATAVTDSYNGGKSIAGCTAEAWTYRWELSKWTSKSSSGGNNVYSTNIPGVGIRITNDASGKVIPYDQSQAAESYIIVRGIKVELIKTGDIAGGTLDTGMLARASIVGQFYFANVTLNGVSTIASESCSVTTNPVNVALGKHDKSEFNGTGTGTGWQTFNIGLNCSKSARINVRIDATADGDATGVPGVIKLDSNPVNASGVGVQLEYFDENNSPQSVQLGQDQYYGSSSSEGDKLIQLQARYYQTTQTIIPGKADATATFTMSYK